eukprot:1150293-Pelagomonas_calceolata.AAC.7
MQPRHTGTTTLVRASVRGISHDPFTAHLEILILLPVAGDHVVAFGFQALRQVRGDEATRAGDADAQLASRPVHR